MLGKVQVVWKQRDVNTSFWLWTCRNADLLCVIFLQWSKAVIWKTIDLIVLVRKMIKITDFNEFSQERLKAWILVFIRVFYLENRGNLGKRTCFAATVKSSRTVRNTSFPFILLQSTFWAAASLAFGGPWCAKMGRRVIPALLTVAGALSVGDSESCIRPRSSIYLVFFLLHANFSSGWK